MDALVHLSSIYVELSLMPEFSAELEQLTDKRRKAMGKDIMDTGVGKVEVSWNGRIESVNFKLPPEAAYLSEFTKEYFMQECDLSTSEKRMKALFEHMPVFIAEMERIYMLAETFPVYRVVAKTIVSFKKGLYLMVVLLNINVLMVTFGNSSEHGYNRLHRAIFHPGDEIISIYLTAFLALLLIAGYATVVVYHGLTEIPILIKDLDDRTEAQLADPTIKPDAYRDAGAFGLWGAALLFNLVFIYIHAINYGNISSFLNERTLVFLLHSDHRDVTST